MICSSLSLGGSGPKGEKKDASSVCASSALPVGVSLLLRASAMSVTVPLTHLTSPQLRVILEGTSNKARPSEVFKLCRVLYIVTEPIE